MLNVTHMKQGMKVVFIILCSSLSAQTRLLPKTHSIVILKPIPLWYVYTFLTWIWERAWGSDTTSWWVERKNWYRLVSGNVPALTSFWLLPTTPDVSFPDPDMRQWMVHWKLSEWQYPSTMGNCNSSHISILLMLSFHYYINWLPLQGLT